MIDFRSDTVTQPTDAMRHAMANAPVGDDVYGDDPTVNRLEAKAAERFGFEAALFTCSGTQANLVGLLAHCERGDEYIVGQDAHTYKYEGGGAAVLGSIQPQPLQNEKDGSIDLMRAKMAIKPDDFHFARTKLFSLENTIGGKVLPMTYLQEAKTFAKENSLAIHMDGARLMNASVKLGIDAKDIVQGFDSFSLCLSKGLCAPIGSLLIGDHAFIQRARRWRKVVGGGMRQAGVLAAAGIIAMEEMVERLREDHDNAAYLAHELSQLEGFSIDPFAVQTNIVFAQTQGINQRALQADLKEQGILISTGYTLRFVTHKDVTRQDCEQLIAAIKSFLHVKR